MKTKAYALLYGAMLLILVGFFILNLRQIEGVKLDRISNSHIHFQSQLYLQSLQKIANLCIANNRFTQAHFDFGAGYEGGFELVNQTIYLYVQAQNKRTSQILRATREVSLQSSP